MTEPRIEGDGETGTRIRDKRRIDPVTGEVRAGVAASATAPVPGPVPPAGEAAAGGDLADLERTLAERTADLQRLKAEYDNYRRRVERDRLVDSERALANVLTNLLPVLDDIARARSHDEVEGVFKLVADGLEGTLAKLGLTAFGEPGDPFDPTVHEALMHSYSSEVSEPTCVEIFQAGFRLGERVLRPARVAVAEPEPESEPVSGVPADPEVPGASDVEMTGAESAEG